MTISIWRYSHLALAVSSFLFVALASVTGIILSVESVQENSYSYQIEDLDEIQLSEVLPVLIEKYPEITELKVDERGYVSLKGFDIEGEKIDAFIDPKSGAILGQPQEQSDFYKWVTALHRSLFLKEIGRFFIGLTAFLLLLITISGIILVVKRQHGWKRFFNKISRDSFFQYYHVVLGRLSLIPIFILALTGTWLSLVRFGVIAEEKNYT
ncbi:MAG: PepSY domain-containing protein [Chitinophagaceae bacterium]|nr:PepSY domain-containing protein [Chitinophagaceae bacterium]